MAPVTHDFIAVGDTRGYRPNIIQVRNHLFAP